MSSEQYVNSVLRAATAKICDHEGVSEAPRSCVDTLTNVAEQFILRIGRKASAAAESANRTETNVLDIAHALSSEYKMEVGSLTSFVPEASKLVPLTIPSFPIYPAVVVCNPVASPPSDSKDNSQQLSSVGGTAVASSTAVPKSILSPSSPLPSSSALSLLPSPANVPPSLPLLPAPHTYRHSAVVNQPPELAKRKAAEGVAAERVLVKVCREGGGPGAATLAGTDNLRRKLEQKK